MGKPPGQQRAGLGRGQQQDGLLTSVSGLATEWLGWGTAEGGGPRWPSMGFGLRLMGTSALWKGYPGRGNGGARVEPGVQLETVGESERRRCA